MGHSHPTYKLYLLWAQPKWLLGLYNRCLLWGVMAGGLKQMLLLLTWNEWLYSPMSRLLEKVWWIYP